MRFSYLSATLLFLVLGTTFLRAEEKYTLRYQFHPGETLRWNVEQRTQMRTSVSKSTQDAETASFSMKTWRVKEVRPDGTAAFEHRVDWVDMRQKLSGSQEIRYDSRTDKTAPPGFQDVAAAVGVPLSTITLDPQGKIVKRQKHAVKGSSSQENGEITLPLPAEPIAIGHIWTQPCDINVPLPTGGVKKINAVQQFKLESVKTGVATIAISTQILTPLTDPAIEAQVVQREGRGRASASTSTPATCSASSATPTSMSSASAATPAVCIMSTGFPKNSFPSRLSLLSRKKTLSNEKKSTLTYFCPSKSVSSVPCPRLPWAWRDFSCLSGMPTASVGMAPNNSPSFQWVSTQNAMQLAGRMLEIGRPFAVPPIVVGHERIAIGPGVERIVAQGIDELIGIHRDVARPGWNGSRLRRGTP